VSTVKRVISFCAMPGQITNPAFQIKKEVFKQKHENIIYLNFRTQSGGGCNWALGRGHWESLSLLSSFLEGSTCFIILFWQFLDNTSVFNWLISTRQNGSLLP
jgi:hypothetical protein